MTRRLLYHNLRALLIDLLELWLTIKISLGLHRYRYNLAYRTKRTTRKPNQYTVSDATIAINDIFTEKGYTAICIKPDNVFVYLYSNPFPPYNTEIGINKDGKIVIAQTLSAIRPLHYTNQVDPIKYYNEEIVSLIREAEQVGLIETESNKEKNQK